MPPKKAASVGRPKNASPAEAQGTEMLLKYIVNRWPSTCALSIIVLIFASSRTHRSPFSQYESSMVIASLFLAWSTLGLIIFPLKKFTADTALWLRLSGILIIGLSGALSAFMVVSDYKYITTHENYKKNNQLNYEQIYLNETIENNK